MPNRALTRVIGTRSGRILLVLVLLLFLGSAILIISLAITLLDSRSRGFLQWWRGDDQTRLKLVTVQQEACPGAPFILPAEGYIGLYYADPRGPYSSSNPHQGIDIFSDAEVGVIPVYAAFDGYITRETDWRSTLIQRIPDDPLNPGEQIWLYYTHMADRDGNDFIIEQIPSDTHDFFVEQGTLLGYTGDYNGNSLRGVWVHLHFSIVKDDGRGGYMNELDFGNTLDPSPYLGLGVNYQCNSSGDIPAGCSPDPSCRG